MKNYKGSLNSTTILSKKENKSTADFIRENRLDFCLTFKGKNRNN